MTCPPNVEKRHFWGNYLVAGSVADWTPSRSGRGHNLGVLGLFDLASHGREAFIELKVFSDGGIDRNLALGVDFAGEIVEKVERQSHD